ncbi:Carnitine transport ATP-binding protein OpuCA (plasmid) [Marinibacterium anthonyi]|nr:Carnitine transport ATP-binding protein OpuCA [Marinibacterium anthonyi]
MSFEVHDIHKSFDGTEVLKGVSLRGSVRELQRKAGVGAVMVTHDQAEARALADRMVIMDHGRIVKFDTPEALAAEGEGEGEVALVS